MRNKTYSFKVEFWGFPSYSITASGLIRASSEEEVSKILEKIYEESIFSIQTMYLEETALDESIPYIID